MLALAFFAKTVTDAGVAALTGESKPASGGTASAGGPGSEEDEPDLSR